MGQDFGVETGGATLRRADSAVGHGRKGRLSFLYFDVLGNSDVQQACDALMSRAFLHGARDNVTVIVLEIP
jgi:hypothetical protein